ncbi:MAG: FAD-dependent oxidoreductase [Bryobacterales bacterium]|nr:FAD-dependent oxidoreductase [Bryobacterales bacterium]
MSARFCKRVALSVASTLVLCIPLALAQDPPIQRADIVIVGSGIGGLSAAWEAGRRGLNVVVLDMFSVYGGHAVMSEGGLCIVDTPLQREQGISDSADLAAGDFESWGVDANVGWVGEYTRRSNEQIFEWLHGLGVQFNGLRKQAGNRVARFHTNAQRGLGIVAPIYRDCLRYPNIRFVWNQQAVSLLKADSRVVGVRVRNTRTGREGSIHAGSVVVATGGYQSSLELVKTSWPKGVAFPENLLLGSGIHATGSGLALARAAGGSTERMDHQWNYPWGMTDPRFPGARRGLNARIVDSIWVDVNGRRFVNEALNARDALAVLLQQTPPMYWAVFDEPGKLSMSVAGTDWVQFSRIEKLLLENPAVTVKAETLDELAAKMNVEAAVLRESVARYNRMADAGEDEDFHRFGSKMPEPTRINDRMAGKPKRIERGPFYASRMGPVTRKSMGGLRVDLQCRVLDAEGEAIEGLYAVGEVTGFGGINGSAGLEGTFLGPSMLQGRIAGREIAKGNEPVPAPSAAAKDAPSKEAVSAAGGACTTCHQMPKLLAAARPGFRHFELVHGVVMERKLPCAACHSEMTPFRAEAHKIDRVAQMRNCAVCHMGRE